MMCPDCSAFMLDLLDKRISAILQVGQSEPGYEGAAQSHCFHLMELQRIVRGEKTCGVFDDYGEPPTISGPLFEERPCR